MLVPTQVYLVNFFLALVFQRVSLLLHLLVS